MGDELKITCTIDGEKATVVLEGALNTMSTPYLAEELGKLGDVKDIDIDASALDCITDQGFELLLEKNAELAAAGGALRLVHPNEVITDTIEMLDIELNTAE